MTEFRLKICWLATVAGWFLAIALFLPIAFAEPLGSVNEPWFSAELFSAGDDFQLEFETPPGPLFQRRASSDLSRGLAFALPGQLIVDLPVICEAKFREVRMVHPLIKRLRYGLRKGQTRVIVDLSSRATPRFVLSSNKTGNRVAVRFDFGAGDLYPETFRAASKASAPFAADEVAEVVREEESTTPPLPARMDALVLYDQFKASTQALVQERENVKSAQVVADAAPAPNEAPNAWGSLLVGGETDSHDGIGLLGLGLRIALIALVGLAFFANVGWGSLFAITPGRESTQTAGDGSPMLSRRQLNLYYQILNVSENDSNATIKSRYRELAKQFHSDTFAANPKSERQGKKIADERFRQIDEAYRMLKQARGMD